MEISGVYNQYVFDQALMPGLASNHNPFEPAKGTGLSFEERLRAIYGTADESVPVIPLGRDSDIDKGSQLFEMCRELETFLLKNLISSMRNTVQKSGLVDIGFAGQFYEDMLYDEYAKSFAENAGFGFAEMAYRELNRKSQMTI